MSEETKITHTFWCAHPKYSNQFKVASFNGVEGISIPYRFEIFLSINDPDIDFSDIVGKDAQLTISTPAGRERVITDRYVVGTIADMSFLGSEQDMKSRNIKEARYRVLLVPPMAKLSLRHNMRIFQEKTTIDIVTQIFSDHKLKDLLDFGNVSKGSYQKRNYCVQYRESDFDFVSRLLEEEGIAYHYVHKNRDLKLVFTDDHKKFTAVPVSSEIQYSLSGLVPTEDTVANLALSQRMQTERVELRDYRFKPGRVSDKNRAGDPQGDNEYEAYDYPSEFVDPNEDVSAGAKLPNQLEGSLAQRRLEELVATTVIGSATSNCNQLMPGHTFKLLKHRRSQLKDKVLLLLRINHTGDQPVKEPGAKGNYGNSFDFMPADLPYRPPRVTHKPVVYGTHTAVVVGPPNEKIAIDKFSRVRVCFHWDRENWSARPSDSSCWVRVAQGWAGRSMGMMFFPRVGQEVLISFIEGDPDRPLLTGRVYNGDHEEVDQLVPNMIGGRYADYGGGVRTDPAWPGVMNNMTRSTLRTASIEGEGYNELRFEDDGQKGQQIYIRAQRDLDIEVLGNQTENVKEDRIGLIKGDQLQWVKGNKYLDVSNEAEILAGSRLLLRCGASAIELTPSGIVIHTPTLTTKAEGGGRMVINGECVQLNCTAGANVPLPEPKISTSPKPSRSPVKKV